MMIRTHHSKENQVKVTENDKRFEYPTRTRSFLEDSTLKKLSSHLFWIVLIPRPFKSPSHKARLNHQRKIVANIVETTKTHEKKFNLKS